MDTIYKILKSNIILPYIEVIQVYHIEFRKYYYLNVGLYDEL